MAIADRVKDTSTSTGTTDFTVSGTPPVGFRAISVLGGVGTTWPYVIESADGSEWECGTATMTSSTSFSRTPTASSNAGAVVNFSEGNKNVYCALTVDGFLNGSIKFTNKRIKQRVSTVNAPGATPSVNTDNFDRLTLTGCAVAITGWTLSGTPEAGDTLIIDITDNGTARAISWTTYFEPSTINMPTTTVAGQKLTVSFDWNPVSSKWRCVGYA